MSKLINVITTVATLAMAAVPLSAIGTVAHAAEHRATAIEFGDLDLSSPAGAAAFQARIDRAADRMCRDAGQPLDQQVPCHAAVREEAMDQLSQEQRQKLQVATQGKTVQAAWRVAGF